MPEGFSVGSCQQGDWVFAIDGSPKIFQGISEFIQGSFLLLQHQGLLPKHSAEPEYDRPAYAWRPTWRMSIQVRETIQNAIGNRWKWYDMVII